VKNLKTPGSPLRSRELDEIVGRPPHWLVQWGLTAFFAVITMVLTMSYFIRYPTVLRVDAVIRPDSSFVMVTVPSDGILTGMLVTEGTVVNTNDPLFRWYPAKDNTERMLRATHKGKVLFLTSMRRGKKLTRGQTLFFLVPASQLFHAEIYCKDEDFAHIRSGQKVLFSLTGQERVTGAVAYINPLRTNKGYKVEVSLNEKNRNFADGLRCTAEIVIKEERLISRFIPKSK